MPTIEALTGSPVRSQYRKPGEPRSRPADAIIVAPATYNTINKWAQGVSDTYALGVLAETTALGVPIVVLPFVNSALAARVPFRCSVESLRSEGVHILLGIGGVEPHEPHTGGELIARYPWDLALSQAERLADLASTSDGSTKNSEPLRVAELGPTGSRRRLAAPRPASAAGSALAARVTLARHTDQGGSNGHCLGCAGPSSSLPIVQLPATASRSPFGRRMRSASPNLDTATTRQDLGACEEDAAEQESSL